MKHPAKKMPPHEEGGWFITNFEQLIDHRETQISLGLCRKKKAGLAAPQKNTTSIHVTGAYPRRP
ncbi:hypothetical protein DK37_10750 [Halomonas sp. SUBG004]|nr:hypothetical protein DK37_10750 [Halomonas sp. SUBG004]